MKIKHSAKSWLCRAFVAFSMLANVVLAAESRPPVVLDPTGRYLDIWTDDWIPEINFYAESNLQGPPIFKLDADGLHRGKEMLCRWPGGRFNPKESYNMVLGYKERIGDSSTPTYLGCGSGAPILSTWGDCGLGTAALFMRVDSVNDSIAVTSHNGKNYYVDLNTIPEEQRRWLEDDYDRSCTLPHP